MVHGPGFFHIIWNSPVPGVKPMSPALAGRWTLPLCNHWILHLSPELLLYMFQIVAQLHSFTCGCKNYPSYYSNYSYPFYYYWLKRPFFTLLNYLDNFVKNQLTTDVSINMCGLYSIHLHAYPYPTLVSLDYYSFS